MTSRKTLEVAVALLAAATILFAQDTPPQENPPAPQTGGPGGRGGGAGANPEPQPYDKVITKDAKTTRGLFTVHQIKERFYYEIPKGELDREFLWNTQIARTAFGVGYGGGQLVDRVVKWELKGNRLLLEEINFGLTADPAQPIALAVKAAN